MLLNPPLPRPQLLEGLLACTPRRPIRLAWCHPSLDPGARATQVGELSFLAHGNLNCMHAPGPGLIDRHTHDHCGKLMGESKLVLSTFFPPVFVVAAHDPRAPVCLTPGPARFAFTIPSFQDQGPSTTTETKRDSLRQLQERHASQVDG